MGSKRIGQVMRVRKVPLLPPSRLRGSKKPINKSIKAEKEKLKKKMKKKKLVWVLFQVDFNQSFFIPETTLSFDTFFQ